jgi:hypothetical protein
MGKDHAVAPLATTCASNDVQKMGARRRQMRTCQSKERILEPIPRIIDFRQMSRYGSKHESEASTDGGQDDEQTIGVAEP